MKRKNISLNCACLPKGVAASETDPIPDYVGDISDCDGRYGFSKAWNWTHQVSAPENWDGSPLPVTLSVRADDSATLSLGAHSASAAYGDGKPGEKSAVFYLAPGFYAGRLQFTNIDYKPPSGNAAVLEFSVSTGAGGTGGATTLVPEENDPAPEDDECERRCGNADDAGGTPDPAAAAAAKHSRTSAEAGASSAGRRARLETNASYARWTTSFGAFRGLGGIDGGALEILAYGFDAEKLASAATLEWAHPLNSWLVIPAGGIKANAQIKLFVGGSYTSWVCDGSGTQFFPAGTTMRTSALLVLSENKSEVVRKLPDGSEVRYSAESGEITSCRTRHGNAFSAAELSAYIDVVRDADGLLLQLWNLWDGLMNVEDVSGTGYAMALYLPSQVGEKSAETGLYAVSGTPFKKFIVAYSPETGKLSITEQDMRTGAPAFPRTLWFANGARQSSVGSGAEEVMTTRVREALSATQYRLTTTVSRGGVPASRVSEVYATDEALGDMLASRTEGCGTVSARTTHYLYDTAGRLVRETRPDGSVAESGYDNFGRLSSRREPAAGARNRTTIYRYVSEDSNDSDLSRTQTSLSTAAGPVLLSRTDYVYAEEADCRRVEKRTRAIGAEDERLEVEETWRGSCANVYARGRVKMTQDARGVQTHYAYAGTTQHGALYCVSAETKIAGEFVNGKSAREVKFVSAEGNVLRKEKHVLDSAGKWRLVSSETNEYDVRNNLTKRTRGNGRAATREMMCCGPLWEIDEDGVRTDYAYDSAQQLTETTRAMTATMPERATLYERDAAGRITRERLKLNSVDFSEKTATWDLLGRLVSETDELGRTASYAYATDTSACAETETVTLSSGATRVTKRHADGTVLLEAGTSRRAVETVIDAVSDGVRDERLRRGNPHGNAEHAWRVHLSAQDLRCARASRALGDGRARSRALRIRRVRGRDETHARACGKSERVEFANPRNGNVL